MNKKHISIKWNIFLYLIGFILLLLMILWLFQTVLLDDFYKFIKRQEVQRDASIFAGMIAEGDYEGVREAAMRGGDLYVELWSEESGETILAGSGPLNNPFDVPFKTPFETASYFPGEQKRAYWEELEQNGGAQTKRFVNTKEYRRGRESILHIQLVDTQEGARLLLVSATISPVNATTRTLQIQLYCISLVLLLLAVGLALLISNRVSKPIAKLNDSAKELMHGKAEFETEGYKEIVELSQSLEQAAQELLKTDRLRRELIANVSHDLRTPLTLITGYGEMMRDIPAENTPENAQVIIDESKRLTSLVGDLLDLSRLQAGVQETRIDSMDLTAEVEQIIGRFGKFCEQEGYAIRFEYEGHAMVRADAERIAQVVYNFIANAITHTGQDKRILLRQIVQNSRVTLEVQDTGDGIPPEHLNEIWEQYYKVDEVHKRSAMGAGLGLSIVKSILEQHPGVQYGVRSEVGKGSVFWFSLPLEGAE